jgi:8-oxo-dGTP pyrophosphatase MutT (NUDIX family)
VGKNAQSQTILTREFSSGGVVYRKLIINNLQFTIEWLVTRSTSSKLYPETYWRLPKGWIDNTTPEIPGPIASGKVRADEKLLQKAALREVREEGGVEAKIVKKIGTEKYFYRLPSRPSSAYNTPDKGKILKFVTFYLMEYVSDLSEGYDEETSEIAWLPFEEAYKKLSFSGEKQILKKAKDGLP